VDLDSTPHYANLKKIKKLIKLKAVGWRIGVRFPLGAQMS
jgi:hypothetical protein